MLPPSALAGLFPAVSAAVFFCFSPVAVGLSIVDDHGFARAPPAPRAGFEGDAGLGSEGGFDEEDFDDGLGPYVGGPVDDEPDTHVYDFERDTASYHNFPSGGRVAVVLRGASFRSRQKSISCAPGDTKAEEMQKGATESLVSGVIVPLEHAGNTVDVFVADTDCDLTETKIVNEWIGRQRVKAIGHNTNKGHDQRRNVLFALDLLTNHSGGFEGVAATYSHVFLLRHDTHWAVDRPMNDWPDADFSRTLFPLKCPFKNDYGAVHDLFFLLPVRYFQPFYTTVEQRRCFHGADGHRCLQAMVYFQGEDSVGVAVRYRPDVSLPWWTSGKYRTVC